MRINQVLVTASPADAITNDALQLRTLLRGVAPSEIYARYIDPALAGEVRPLTTYDDVEGCDRPEDLLLYHAAIGEPSVFEFVCARRERVAIVYHNISPAEVFEAYEPEFARLLRTGREELAALANVAVAGLAVSEYNAGELEQLGFRNVHVAPLRIDTEALHEVEPDAGTSHHLQHEVDGPALLFVGQILPHKRPDLLVHAYHLLVTHILPEARLFLVGSPRLRRYSDLIRMQVQELNLNRLHMVGSVSFAQLAAFYRRADAFVTASEHEGFCVPLVEAMSFGLPVVARAHAAIPDTVGQAGLVLPPDDDPLLLAEAMALVLTEQTVRDGFAEQARRRAEHYSLEHARAAFLSRLLDIL